MSEPTEDLLRQLDEAATVVRELLADVRSATKDLRHAIKDAREEGERLATTVEDAVRSDINAAVKRELEELGKVLNERREWMVGQVAREFDRYINLLTTGREDGKTVPGRNLRFVLPPLPSFHAPANRKQPNPKHPKRGR